MLTAVAHRERVGKVRALIVQDYALKPFKRETLLLSVDQSHRPPTAHYMYDSLL
jgi:hypothetical protein